MIGGLFKSNRLAVLAGSAFIAGGLAVSPAQAADLGGDCCADLEERVAVLEATTARKGNRKVSLTISGMMYHQLMIWDDGFDEDAYVGTNVQDAGTWLVFSGNAKIDSRLSAGYAIRLVLNMGDSYSQDQFNDDGLFDDIYITNSNIWIKHEQLGKLTIGREHPPADNIGFVDFSGFGSVISANLVMFDGAFMRLRRKDGTFLDNGLMGDDQAFARWGSISNCNHNGPGVHNDCDGYPQDIIRYDSPTIAGFVFSAAWGEDDRWDVALRYNGNIGDFKVYVGASYSDMSDDEAGPVTSIEFFQVGFAVKHEPTGLFANGVYGNESVDLSAAAGTATKPDTDTWYLKAGIVQKWNALGNTVLYGEYGESQDGFDATANLFDGLTVIGSNWEQWGVGIVQDIDAASMSVFLKYKHFEGDIDTTTGNVEFEDLDVIGIGATLTF